MRGVVANSGMRALGLAPMNEELDNAVTVFLLAPHWLGGGGMGDPVIKCVQDSAITILAGLQHDSVAVRDNYENLLAHAGDRTRDMQGDPTAARCLQFLRHHAEMQIHWGKQHVPAPRQAFKFQPSQIFSHNNFLFGIEELLKNTMFQYLPTRDPVVLMKEPDSHTLTCSWTALPVEESEAQTRAQSLTMVPGILWIGLNATGKHSWRRGVYLQKGEPASVKKSQFGQPIQMTASYTPQPTETLVRYAYGAHGNGSGSVLQICVPAVVVSYGAKAVQPVNRKNERAHLSIAEDSRAAFFARKDFETLLLVPNLSTVDGHILANLHVAHLQSWCARGTT